MFTFKKYLVSFQILLTANTANAFSTTPSNSITPAYVLIEAKLDPTQLEQFGIYVPKVAALVQKYGGEYIVLKGEHTPLEGEWDDTRIVLQKWKSKEDALNWWNSDEYQQVKQIRKGTGDFRIMLVEGLEEILPDDVSL
ncbi:hypothetical protein CTEN210_11704 [Chaetoceros tenuissimus]|uniref:DUF1330 domain-containing protein n=1 Tax=Chaetoceros tenuissimus TaxID=426638 RepID=A0AAD3D054_9STRA|nr:hypothetical protein CTEN210_11704 [Chaetoceros tenuissimus]